MHHRDHLKNCLNQANVRLFTKSTNLLETTLAFYVQKNKEIILLISFKMLKQVKTFGLVIKN
jgi:hypothetical protein